jgi:transcriptional regulator with XRE-family HTH domain
MARRPVPQPHPIKGVLADRRITLVELASPARCNRGTLGRVVNGYQEPWPALRERLAAYLDLPEEDLFNEPDRVLQ